MQRNFDALAGEVDGIEPDPWTNVTSFLNGWVNFDANRKARYYRANGRVYLEGIIKSGTMNQPAFNLPPGYRITTGDNATFPVNSNGAFGVVVVNPNGNVAPSSGTNAAVDLSNISFRHG